MRKLKKDVLILILIVTVILIMISNIGIFIKMNQLQNTLIQFFRPPQGVEVLGGLYIGVKAPDFTLTDTEGKMVSINDFNGRKMLLGFSAINCPPCIELYSDLKTFSDRQDNSQVIIISMGSPEDNIKLKEDQKFNFLILNWNINIE